MIISKREIENFIHSIEWHKRNCNVHDCEITIFDLVKVANSIIESTKHQIDICDNDRIIWQNRLNKIGY